MKRNKSCADRGAWMETPWTGTKKYHEGFQANLDMILEYYRTL